MSWHDSCIYIYKIIYICKNRARRAKTDKKISEKAENAPYEGEDFFDDEDDFLQLEEAWDFMRGD